MHVSIFAVARWVVRALGCAIVLNLAAPRADALLLLATVRDFKIEHPDFEGGISGVVTGLVGSTLPADKNPVFVAAPGSGAITEASTFAEWYKDVPGVNLATPLMLDLVETAPGSGAYAYHSDSFFPIDDMLFGNEGLWHNFHLTLELHTTFTYVPGQTFSFVGDDDVWVYIDNELVVDLGGVHGAAAGGVDLDTLGLTAGERYDFDFLFAERHTTESTFHIETGIVFDPNVPAVPEPGGAVASAPGIGAAALLLRRRSAGGR